jgi:hypothetical protein
MNHRIDPVFERGFLCLKDCVTENVERGVFHKVFTMPYVVSTHPLESNS